MAKPTSEDYEAFEKYLKESSEKEIDPSVVREGTEGLRIAARGDFTIHKEAKSAPEADMYKTNLTVEELKDFIEVLEDAKELVENSLGDQNIFGFKDPQNTPLSAVVERREELPRHLDEAIEVLEVAEGEALDRETKLYDLPAEFDKAMIIHKEQLRVKQLSGQGEGEDEEREEVVEEPQQEAAPQENEVSPTAIMEDIGQLAKDRKTILSYLDEEGVPFFENPEESTLGQVRKICDALPPELGVIFGGTERYKSIPDDTRLSDLPDAISGMMKKDSDRLFEIADEYNKRNKEREE